MSCNRAIGKKVLSDIQHNNIQFSPGDQYLEVKLNREKNRHIEFLKKSHATLYINMMNKHHIYLQ